MEIKTRFELSQKVWRIHENRVEEVKIIHAAIFARRAVPPGIETPISIEYAVESPSENGYPKVAQDLLFASKAELLASL